METVLGFLPWLLGAAAVVGGGVILYASGLLQQWLPQVFGDGGEHARITQQEQQRQQAIEHGRQENEHRQTQEREEQERRTRQQQQADRIERFTDGERELASAAVRTWARRLEGQAAWAEHTTPGEMRRGINEQQVAMRIAFENWVEQLEKNPGDPNNNVLPPEAVRLLRDMSDRRGLRRYIGELLCEECSAFASARQTETRQNHEIATAPERARIAALPEGSPLSDTILGAGDGAHRVTVPMKINGQSANVQLRGVREGNVFIVTQALINPERDNPQILTLSPVRVVVDGGPNQTISFSGDNFPGSANRELLRAQMTRAYNSIVTQRANERRVTDINYEGLSNPLQRNSHSVSIGLDDYDGDWVTEGIRMRVTRGNRAIDGNQSIQIQGGNADPNISQEATVQFSGRREGNRFMITYVYIPYVDYSGRDQVERIPIRQFEGSGMAGAASSLLSLPIRFDNPNGAHPTFDLSTQIQNANVRRILNHTIINHLNQRERYPLRLSQNEEVPAAGDSVESRAANMLAMISGGQEVAQPSTRAPITPALSGDLPPAPMLS